MGSLNMSAFSEVKMNSDITAGAILKKPKYSK